MQIFDDPYELLGKSCESIRYVCPPHFIRDKPFIINGHVVSYNDISIIKRSACGQLNNEACTLIQLLRPGCII